MSAAAPSPDRKTTGPEATQQQFLEVISRDEAKRRFHQHLSLHPLGVEQVLLSLARNRVLGQDVVSDVDVPAFDRANVDGFAVRAEDTIGASEDHPRTLNITSEPIAPGALPLTPVTAGAAAPIATGAMLPRGADSVLMIEFTDLQDGDATTRLLVRCAVGAGDHIAYAGSDIARGETVLRAGQLLTSREIGVLAAIGCAQIPVYRRPRVAVLSTGNELVPPGGPLPPGAVYDSNASVLSSAVEELGGEPVPFGIVADDEAKLEAAVRRALACDVILLSGGTSKGAGDVSYRVVRRLGPPGIVAHGVALKPGKPVCLAVVDGKPVVILPGFPTSAIFTFHEFVAPLLSAFSGRPVTRRDQVTARVSMPLNSERGRTEYLLVRLLESDDGLTAYSLGTGSGSVTTFSRADGFLTIDQHTELIGTDEQVEVSLLGEDVAPADLVVMTSHCAGLDRLLGLISERGYSVKVMLVGSSAALQATGRGECDLGGLHLLDPATNEYNRPFVNEVLQFIPGYRRLQCVVSRPDDPRFRAKTLVEAVRAAVTDPECRMVNRNPGSGTRVVIDGLLKTAAPDAGHPPGYHSQVRSHHAVCAAVKDARADWGVAIDTVARMYGLQTIPCREEQFDFVVPRSRLNRPAVQEFLKILQEPDVRKELTAMGFHGLQT